MPHSLGWKRDLPDARDYRFSIPPFKAAVLPPMVDLRPKCPPVLDQGQLGSCVSHAVSSALEFDQMKQGIPPYTPSRLFIYYVGRVLEGSVPYDSGLTIRDGVKAIAQSGYCEEREWGYDIAQFATRPPDTCFTTALPRADITYARVAQDLQQLQGTLAAGFVVVFGFTVYTSFESDVVAKTGIVPMPGTSEAAVGGHACVICGYDNSMQCFYVRNSWGSNWGLIQEGFGGYFMMPYAYLLDPNLSSDFWVVNHIVG